MKGKLWVIKIRKPDFGMSRSLQRGSLLIGIMTALPGFDVLLTRHIKTLYNIGVRIRTLKVGRMMRKNCDGARLPDSRPRPKPVPESAVRRVSR